jgi:hypothetical protein
MAEHEEMNGMAEAMAELAKLEAAASGANSDDQGGGDAASANQEQRAAQLDGGDDPVAQELSQTDTPAGAEPAGQQQQEQPKDEQSKAPKPEEAAEAGKSKFAKDKARRDDSWKALNAEKETLAQERARLQAEREAWLQEQQQAQAIQQITPDKYETFARQMRQTADHLRAEAERLEEAGKYDDANAKREEAAEAEVDHKRAWRKAAELRSNPQAQAAAGQTAEQRKAWTMRAAQEFPELARDNSEFQLAVGKVLQTLPGEMKALPQAIYYASRLAAAETGAAGVPGLRERLGQAEARVKELEAMTSLGDAGQTTRLAGEIPFDQRSRDEQFGELSRLAQNISL